MPLLPSSRNPAGVASPLDLLNDVTDEDVRAVVVATSTQSPTR
jgi:hypothetical protein